MGARPGTICREGLGVDRRAGSSTWRVEAGAVISSHVPHVKNRCWAHPSTWNARLSLPGA
uniref:Uncharacterized protein n=1 Tax=Arundo donax TaxID=35708 RepID=A0A0A9EVZ9_ARUDO